MECIAHDLTSGPTPPRTKTPRQLLTLALGLQTHLKHSGAPMHAIWLARALVCALAAWVEAQQGEEHGGQTTQ